MDIQKYLTKKDDGNSVLLLVGIAVAILVLAVIFTVGPIVGYQVDSAVTIPAGQTGAAASWNSNNTGFTNGSELWTQNTPMLAVAALISIVGVIIVILMGVANNNR